MNRPKRLKLVSSLLLRSSFFAVLWWVLAEGEIEDPFLVMGCIALALAASQFLWPAHSWHWRPLGWLRFIPFFLIHTFSGGLDVARRAFLPRMPLQPGFVVYPLELSENQALLLAWAVSLLPGTASVELSAETLKIHVLDTRLPVQERTKALERRVRDLCA